MAPKPPKASILTHVEGLLPTPGANLHAFSRNGLEGYLNQSYSRPRPQCFACVDVGGPSHNTSLLHMPADQKPVHDCRIFLSCLIRGAKDSTIHTFEFGAPSNKVAY
ncbi:hypothetical protein PMIN06_002298 [Paraphaeosphaeria minitans]